MRLPALCAGGAVLTGLLLASLFPPLGWNVLAPVALTPLLFAMAHEPRPLRRFLFGWLSGAVFWILVCHWIRDVLANYGGLNAALSWLALALFAAAKGLHTAVFATLAGPVMRRWWATPAVAALWTGIERMHGPLGFAWLVLGNAGAGMAVPLRLAPWTGVYGLSFAFALIGAAAAALALRRKRLELAWLLPLLALWLLPAVERRSAYDREAVAVQINTAGDAQWNEDVLRSATRRMALRTLEMALDPSRPRASLLLWPEVPAPFYYYDDPQFRHEATETARLARAPFLFGTVAWTADRAPSCSIRAEGWPDATTRRASSPLANLCRRASGGSARSPPRPATTPPGKERVSSTPMTGPSAPSSAMNPHSRITFGSSLPTARKCS